jgi:hypothetical protein
MTRSQLVAFVRKHELAVEASVTAGAAPQAAVVGIAVTDELELIFDTVNTTRKYANLRENPKIAFVIGWADECTLQYEGVADFPSGDELERLKEIYFAKFPDGRERLSWAGITYVRTRPTWIRFSDFRVDPPLIVELAE